ncbi:MAG: acetate--CoA ligase, partial [Pirellulaceae bacterium]
MPDILSSDTQNKLIPPYSNFAGKAHCASLAQYEEMYKRSIEQPDAFWAEIADTFVWQKKWDQVLDYSFEGNVFIKWFVNGKTNISVNALDRHLEKRGDQVAIIWEGNAPGEQSTLTYRQLHTQVCKFANVLKSLGVKKGDRVCLYMQMIPELPMAMLACARIGAIHSVVFGAFSEDSLRDRIQDSECKIVVTQDTALRGNKNDIEMKTKADTAIAQCPSVKHMVIVKRTGLDVPMQAGRDVWWHEAMAKADAHCEPVWLDAEDPLFILYTSGSTGKPKGVLHTTGGYMVFAATTFKYIFDYKEGDVWWCTADIGWITGHSYIVYGPLCTGATSVMFEGVPTYPDAGRFWDVVDKYKVTQFYTAPTAIRALMRHGEEPINARDLSSLKLLGSVGEPINPEVWLWYWRHIGKEQCPVVDTWWQTETGGILITPLPGSHVLKPGSASRPFFGVEPVVVDDHGREEPRGVAGKLCIKKPWPGIMRTTWGDHDRFVQTYFSTFKGLYFSGDGCRVDEDGDYWLLGRVDDVINVSGHRLGTAEVESALVSHPAVAEAAVVGCPHEIKGQGIYAYVTLRVGQEPNDALLKALINHVRKEIGPIATPDVIQWAPSLPKTRSGKIM